MKICMFTNTYLPHVGGVARSVHQFVQDLRSLNHQVLIVAPTFPRDMGQCPDDDQLIRVPAIQNFNGSDFSVRIPIPFILNKRLSEFKPDIVHSHHPYLLGDTALRTAFRKDLPLIFTHHTLYERYTHYVPLDSETMKRLAIGISTEYANYCRCVLAPSRSIADIIVQRGVRTPVRILPTGVDTEFFSSGGGEEMRSRLDIPADALVMGHVGRLAPEKNLRFLAGAAAMAMENMGDRLHFLIAGSGPEKAAIAELFQSKGLEKRLHLLGELQGSDLAQAYAAMDFFVFASKTETQGMVITEAMAAGVPVLALDASGVREVVDDGINGRLLSGNAEEQNFSRAISEICSGPKILTQWSARALEKASYFSRQACADRLVEIYQEVLENDQGYGVWPASSFDAWDKLLISMKTEWKIISEKAGALARAVQKSKQS